MHRNNQVLPDEYSSTAVHVWSREFNDQPDMGLHFQVCLFVGDKMKNKKSNLISDVLQ